MTKLLDFWAPWCIDPETLVLTENGYLRASQIQVGQKLVTINPKTKKQSIKKVQTTIFFKDVPSKKIVLETGRELVGDTNHLILTQEGFKKLDEIQIGEAILVNPVKDDFVFQSDNKATILEISGNEYADKILTKLNYLPLKANDHRLQILARLLGFVMTDGYLYEDLKHNIYETHFFVGTDQDAQEIETDLQDLGFNRLEIKRKTNKRKDGNREYTISCLRCRNLNRTLFFLLKALGCPVGRKKNQAYFIPDWVMDGDTFIKRAFLSGWLGGDGCKITYKIKQGGTSSHDAGFNVNTIEFHKEKELEREGILYAKQLAVLFEDLGVEVREVSSGDDEDGVIIYLRLSHSYTSLLNLSSIGYAYASTKNKQVPYIREFLRYRLLERNRYSQAKQIALQQLALGANSSQIAQSLQIPVGTVVSWNYTSRNAQVVYPSKTGEALFTKWLEQRQQGDLLWEKVLLSEDIENRDVIGITVGNPYTLVTNGIVSHNCGPCRAMNPIIEELEKELADKIEVEKINVDENQDKASKYGVMSIPTYIVLKDDKEVGRKIGMTSKEDLLKLLQ